MPLTIGPETVSEKANLWPAVPMTTGAESSSGCQLPMGTDDLKARLQGGGGGGVTGGDSVADGVSSGAGVSAGPGLTTPGIPSLAFAFPTFVDFAVCARSGGSTGTIGAATAADGEVEGARVASCALCFNVTAPTAAVYARLRLGLKEKGKPIPENDLWVAALCVEHQVPLATLDGHFDAVEELERRGL